MSCVGSAGQRHTREFYAVLVGLSDGIIITPLRFISKGLDGVLRGALTHSSCWTLRLLVLLVNNLDEEHGGQGRMADSP